MTNFSVHKGWQIFRANMVLIIWYALAHLFTLVCRHIHTHTTHRPVFAEIQVVSSVLAVQQKKADGKVDSLPWTHGLGTHQTVGEPTETIGRRMEYQYLSCTNIQTHTYIHTHPSPPPTLMHTCYTHTQTWDPHTGCRSEEAWWSGGIASLDTWGRNAPTCGGTNEWNNTGE